MVLKTKIHLKADIMVNGYPPNMMDRSQKASTISKWLCGLLLSFLSFKMMVSTVVLPPTAQIPEDKTQTAQTLLSDSKVNFHTYRDL